MAGKFSFISSTYPTIFYYWTIKYLYVLTMKRVARVLKHETSPTKYRFCAVAAAPFLNIAYRF